MPNLTATQIVETLDTLVASKDKAMTDDDRTRILEMAHYYNVRSKKTTFIIQKIADEVDGLPAAPPPPPEPAAPPPASAASAPPKRGPGRPPKRRVPVEPMTARDG